MTCSCMLQAQLSSLSDYDETVCQGRRICVCTSLSLSGSCCPAICLCSSLAPVSVYLLDLGLQYNWNCWQEHNLGCIFLYRNYPNLDIFLPSLWIMYEAWWHWHWWLVSTTLVPSSPPPGDTDEAGPGQWWHQTTLRPVTHPYWSCAAATAAHWRPSEVTWPGLLVSLVSEGQCIHPQIRSSHPTIAIAQRESALGVGGHDEHFCNYFAIWKNLDLSLSQQKLYLLPQFISLNTLLPSILGRLTCGRLKYHCALHSAHPPHHSTGILILEKKCFANNSLWEGAKINVCLIK